MLSRGQINGLSARIRISEILWMQPQNRGDIRTYSDANELSEMTPNREVILWKRTISNEI